MVLRRRLGALRKLTPSQNHLIETASQSTGSLLIWDTGEYEILPYHEMTHKSTDDELSSSSSSSFSNDNPPSKLSDSQKLHQAFQNVLLPSLHRDQCRSDTNNPTSAKSASASTAPVYPKTTPSPSVSTHPKTATRNHRPHPESESGKHQRRHQPPTSKTTKPCQKPIPLQ